MIAALVLLTLQGGPGLTCGVGQVRVAVADGWIEVHRGRDELAEDIRVRIWGPWVHESGCAQLDDDPEEEFFVVSRSTGTGPFYRIQILDFEQRGEGPEPEWGVRVWSYGSEGKPSIEDGRVLLGELPVDRWWSKGPAIYRPHRLTRDGLLLEEGATDCLEVAPALRTGARSEPVVSLSVDLLANGGAAIVEIATSLGKGAEGGSADECAMAVTVKNSRGEALGAAAELPVTSCAGVGLRSASAWRLAGGGALAALELGSLRTRSAAGDLHIVYLGRYGRVWKLANLAEVGGLGSSPTGAPTTEAGVRLFRMGSSTVLAVETGVTPTRGGEPATKSTDWLELSIRRDELLRLPEERARECAPGGSSPAERS